MADMPALAPTRDARILQWMNAKEAASQANLVELYLRSHVANELFPTPSEGTNTIELGNDWEVKLTYNLTHKLNNKEKDGYLTTAALTRMSKLSAESSVKAQRLCRWQPELSISEYRKLNDAERACLSEGKIPALVITPPGTPQLTMKPPAGWAPK